MRLELGEIIWHCSGCVGWPWSAGKTGENVVEVPNPLELVAKVAATEGAKWAGVDVAEEGIEGAVG